MLVFIGLDRSFTWLATLVMFALLLVCAGKAVKNRWDGVFVDNRNRISLSRLQLVLWTLLLGSALLTAGLANVAVGWPTPLQIAVPASVWALLGIGSFSFVASPVILRQAETQPAPPAKTQDAAKAAFKPTDGTTSPISFTGRVATKDEVKNAAWVDIVRGDTEDAAYVDVSKIQQLAFTALLLMVYGAALFGTFGAGREIVKFPDVDGGFVSLLGLSHAAYLAYKAAPKPA
jgi:hypothetical protein